MRRRDFAVIKGEEESERLRPVSVEKAAENVSNELDKVIHERMRLGIISALAANDTLSFTELRNLLIGRSIPSSSGSFIRGIFDYKRNLQQCKTAF